MISTLSVSFSIYFVQVGSFADAAIHMFQMSVEFLCSEYRSSYSSVFYRESYCRFMRRLHRGKDINESGANPPNGRMLSVKLFSCQSALYPLLY